jgi:hypothetical protein
MTNVMWIDLDAAAGWLSSSPEDVMTLIREGVLGAKRISRCDLVVRGADVKTLARFWIRQRANRRRTRCTSQSTIAVKFPPQLDTTRRPTQ